MPNQRIYSKESFTNHNRIDVELLNDEAHVPTMTEPDYWIIQVYSSCDDIIINPAAITTVTTNIIMKAPPNTHLYITHINTNTCMFRYRWIVKWLPTKNLL